MTMLWLIWRISCPKALRHTAPTSSVRLSSAKDVLNFKEGESLGRKRLTASLFGNLTYGVESEYSSLAATATELRNITKALKRKSVVNEYSGPDGTVEAFLKALISDGNDIRSAFRTARAAVQKRYPDLYYWSGFLLLD